LLYGSRTEQPVLTNSWLLSLKYTDGANLWEKTLTGPFSYTPKHPKFTGKSTFKPLFRHPPNVLTSISKTNAICPLCVLQRPQSRISQNTIVLFYWPILLFQPAINILIISVHAEPSIHKISGSHTVSLCLFQIPVKWFKFFRFKSKPKHYCKILYNANAKTKSCLNTNSCHYY